MSPDSDLADDIVQGEVPKHLPPPGAPRTEFKAWHRVRKHFIRERQWNHEINHLAQRRRRVLQTDESEWGDHLSDGGVSDDELPEDVRISRPLRLLVLPGDDLLDVRSLWGKLHPQGCYLQFLGFNSSLSSVERQNRMAVTESAVTQLNKICKRSHVSSDRFQDIARENSKAYRGFREYGPYDVVNLDLCDSLVPRGRPQETEDYYSAIHQLLNYQLNHQTEPWLLFVTTQVDRDTVDQSAIDRLAKPMRRNCDQHTEFAEELDSIVPSDSFKSTAYQFDLSHVDQTQLVGVFGVILGKWLVDTLGSASPPCSVTLLRSYRYVIHKDKNVQMLSLGFLIKPHRSPPVDPSGLSRLKPKISEFPSELDTALGILTIAKEIKDVDELLREDPDAHSSLAEGQADLLAAAGYDRDAYLNWVAEGENSS